MKNTNPPKSRKNEITIAIIGLLGVLVTATFSNWDKIFPNQNEIIVEYSGYQATENFETELRHYFNVSGSRSAIENMQEQMMINLRMNLIRESPDKAEEINLILDTALDEAITVDEVIKKLLPVYRNHFTIEELQELNKFYSTEIMQNLVRKTPTLMREAAPIQVELLQDFQSRYYDKLNEILPD